MAERLPSLYKTSAQLWPLAVSILFRIRRKSSSGSSSSSKKKKVTLPSAEAAFPQRDELAKWAKWAKWAGLAADNLGEAHSLYDVVCADQKAQKKEAWHLYIFHHIPKSMPPIRGCLPSQLLDVTGCPEVIQWRLHQEQQEQIKQQWLCYGGTCSHRASAPAGTVKANDPGNFRSTSCLPCVLCSTPNVSLYFIFHQPLS